MEDSSVKSTGDRVYQTVIIVLFAIMALCAILPFLLLVSSSLTEESTLLREGYSFIPKKFSTYAYYYLFQSNGAKVFKAYGITFFVTIVGTCISLLIGPMLGWVLSRKDYKHGKVLTFMVFFTMLFNGGVVPSYIMYTQLFHMKNSLLALPIVAMIGLMVGLGYWNDWNNGLYYISDTNLYSLQQLLKSIIDNVNTLANMATTADAAAAVAKMPGTSIRMAMAVIGVIPVMVLYPFFQKAFIAGISLGGVKE